jgi:hypothetical protein
MISLIQSTFNTQSKTPPPDPTQHIPTQSQIQKRSPPRNDHQFSALQNLTSSIAPLVHSHVFAARSFGAHARGTCYELACGSSVGNGCTD